MSCSTTKPTKWSVHPAKMGIRPHWSESSLSAWRNHGSLTTHWAHSGLWSDWVMPRLIWVYDVRTSFCWFCCAVAQIIVLLCCGSNHFKGKRTECRSWVVRKSKGVWNHFMIIQYMRNTHYYNSNLSARVYHVEYMSSYQRIVTRRFASSVIRWCELIQKMWYNSPHQVTTCTVIICLLYRFFCLNFAALSFDYAENMQTFNVTFASLTSFVLDNIIVLVPLYRTKLGWRYGIEKRE